MREIASSQKTLLAMTFHPPWRRGRHGKLSCYRCQAAEAHLTCVYNDKDDVRAIFDKMAAADIVVFATPIYLMNMSGLLKTLLDRLYSTMDISDVRLSNGLIHHHVNPAISSKPFVALVVCSNLEDEAWRNVAAYFRTYARFKDGSCAMMRGAAGPQVLGRFSLLTGAAGRNKPPIHPSRHDIPLVYR